MTLNDLERRDAKFLRRIPVRTLVFLVNQNDQIRHGNTYRRFRLDALALSVIATAMCLAGWLAGWVSVTLRYCIKTAKPIWKLFQTIWKPHHSSFLRPLRRYKIPRETPSAGALNKWGWENWRFSCDFRRKSPFISETVRDRPMVTMKR